MRNDRLVGLDKMIVIWRRRSRSDDAAKGESEMAEKPTKAEWERVEESLRSYYSTCALMCDGFHVTLRLEPVSAFKNTINVYVNGILEFYVDDCEERRRFHFPSVRKYHSAAKQRRIRKLPKWLRKELGISGDPDASYTIHKPWWGSFKSLKAHLIKHNESIELLKNWKYKPEGTE